MTSGMAWEKDHVTIGKFSGQKLVRRRTKRSPNLDPFLIREPFDMIQSTPADDTDTMCSHQGYNSSRIIERQRDFLGLPNPRHNVGRR